MAINAAENYMDALASAIPMTHENAPGFVASVKRLAERAGVTGPLHIELVPSEIPNASFRRTTAGKTLSFSEGLCKLLDTHSLHAPPSSEMEAVISHELSHARHAFWEATPRIALIAGLPLAGMGAMYLIDKTNEKLRKRKQLSLENPQSFWQAFNETLHEVWQAGAGNTIREFSIRSSPLTAKVMSPKPPSTRNATMVDMINPKAVATDGEDYSHIYEDMTWAKATMEEAKYLAVSAAALVPALAACRNLSVANEFRADRFAVALTGHKGMAPALRKITAEAQAILVREATTPVEKSWVGRISQSITDYMKEALLGTHPSTSSRIAAIHATDITAAAEHFRL